MDLDTREGKALFIFHQWRKERLSKGDTKTALENLGLTPEIRPERDYIGAYNPETGEWVEEE